MYSRLYHNDTKGGVCFDTCFQARMFTLLLLLIAGWRMLGLLLRRHVYLGLHFTSSALQVESSYEVAVARSSTKSSLARLVLILNFDPPLLPHIPFLRIDHYQ